MPNDDNTTAVPTWLVKVAVGIAALMPPSLVSLGVWTVVTIHNQDTRLTALETNSTHRDGMLIEIKTEVRNVNSNLLTLQREFDRAFGGDVK